MPPAGWHKFADDTIGYWNGYRYTRRSTPARFRREQRLRRWCRGGGITLIVVGSLAITLGVLGLMGDSFPTRAGVTRDGDTLQVAVANCPGDRVTEIELRDSAGIVVWRALGDARVSVPVEFGTAPDGMTTTVPLRRRLVPGAQFSLRVRTTDLDSPSDVAFTVAEVPQSPRILDTMGVQESVAAFEQSRFDDVPCGDPYGNGAAARWVARFAGGGLVALVAGMILKAYPRRKAWV